MLRTMSAIIVCLSEQDDKNTANFARLQMKLNMVQEVAGMKVLAKSIMSTIGNRFALQNVDSAKAVIESMLLLQSMPKHFPIGKIFQK